MLGMKMGYLVRMWSWCLCLLSKSILQILDAVAQSPGDRKFLY